MPQQSGASSRDADAARGHVRLTAAERQEMKVSIGASVLTRDLVWCECGRGLCGSGYWEYCPKCGGKLNQASYRAACAEAERNGQDIARYADGELADRIKTTEQERDGARHELDLTRQKLAEMELKFRKSESAFNKYINTDREWQETLTRENADLKARIELAKELAEAITDPATKAIAMDALYQLDQR